MIAIKISVFNVQYDISLIYKLSIKLEVQAMFQNNTLPTCDSN